MSAQLNQNTTTTATPMEPKNQTIAIVFVPLPMHSHLDQLLRLALLLSSHPSSSSLSLHYAAPATQLKELRSRLHSSTNTIQFHELPIPTPLYNPTSTASSNYPSHFGAIFEAFELARYPLSTLLSSLSSQHSRLVVVHDPLASFAAIEAESLPNSEAFSFFCVPALFLLNYWHGDSTEEFLRSNSVNIRIPKLDFPVPEKIATFSKRHLEAKSSISSGVFVNTCRPLEGEIVDLLAQEPKSENCKLFSIAPITFRSFIKDDSTSSQSSQHECMEWLDKQPAESVVYISFGTTTMLDKGKIEQLSSALLRCAEQRFVWVLREADKYDVLSNAGNSHYSMLPSNFEHDVEGRGMVFTKWAPQVEILAHRSIGAFLSHCGWNSCMESLLNGVPIIAWPMAGDQPINAAIVADYLKAGVTVRDCASIDEIVTAENIEDAMKRTMVYDEGKEMRNRAKMLGEAMRESASEGGTSRVDLDAFVCHVTRDSIAA